MKNYYISSFTGDSGISKYSRDFYNLVLKQRGYEFLESNQHLSTIMTRVHSTDNVHIEIGVFQRNELEILFAMLNAGYSKVNVTLHDAPLIKYPFRNFRSGLALKASKFYDIYINRFASLKPFVKMINAIYVLSKKGVEKTKQTYGIQNVYFLPHVVDRSEIILSPSINSNFIYFGFIGRNKGLEYSLQLHEEILKTKIDCQFFVVGKPIGKEVEFYEAMKKRFSINVHYLGFVPDNELDRVFERANFAILPFQSYRFFVPISGSILYNQKRGKIVFTTPVNATSELVDDGVNGYFLSGVLNDDVSRILSVFNESGKLRQIKEETFSRLIRNHVPEVVGEYILS